MLMFPTRMPKGMQISYKKQYKLYDFIGKHFGGNITKAARFLEMKPPSLNKIVHHGTYGRKSVDRILSKFKELDESVTFESLFIENTLVPKPVKIKQKLVLPDPIRPTKGSVTSEPASTFSGILDNWK